MEYWNGGMMGQSGKAPPTAVIPAKCRNLLKHVPKCNLGTIEF